MKLCRSFALSAAVLLFSAQSLEAVAHSLPLNRIAVNLKDNRLYVVTAIEVRDVVAEEGRSQLEIKDALTNWFYKAVEWEEISAQEYQDLRIEMDVTHQKTLVAICYAVIELPDNATNLTFSSDSWFSAQIGKSPASISYSFRREVATGEIVRDVMDIENGTPSKTIVISRF